ncbi:ribonuclease D [Flexivirga meconopsidis]|uniref:ribonuclease D n=1 Tax=Flexivirga meconopsidis TaxID=2977121 RepID=UPI00223ECC7B
MTPVTVLEGDLTPELARDLRAARRVAVDTETSGLDWVTDELQLCQLFTPATGAVLLRNVTDRPSQLADLLADANVVKVFHFAPFDLRFLQGRWGASVRSVECTKAASKILFPDLASEQHSLRGLLHRLLDIEISKGSVRTSDWGTPQLSAEQMRYAATDVEHLLVLAELLGQRLVEAGVRPLFEKVCAYMPVDAQLEVSGIPNPLTY